MRIGLSINTSWNIYNFRKGLIHALMGAGHEVITIGPQDKYISKLEAWGCTHEVIDISSTGVNPAKETKVIREYRRILKRQKVDVLLTYTIKPNIYGTLAARHLGIPTICNVSGLGTVFLNKGILSNVARRFYQFALKRAAFIFFQNPSDKEDFLSALPLPKHRVGLLPGSGINLKEYQAQEYIPGEKIRFLMTARLIREKGVYEFVEAARLINEENNRVEFCLIGSHDVTHSRAVDSEDLKRWIDQGTIVYKEHSDDIPVEVAKSDVVVLPSYREGMSRTLLEGAALGRALITTDTPGCRDIVKDGYNGFLCKISDGKSLSDQFRRYLELSVGERIEMAENSRRVAVEQFDEQIVIKKYLEKLIEIGG